LQRMVGTDAEKLEKADSPISALYLLVRKFL
jgi:hypothetical protein